MVAWMTFAGGDSGGCVIGFSWEEEGEANQNIHFTKNIVISIQL